jgi:hypothetical protein
LEDHPGNIFLAGERVSFRLPVNVSGTPASWRMSDDSGETLCEGTFSREDLRPWAQVTVGVLGIGWYRIDLLDVDGKQVGWTAAGVVARLKQPTPLDSPICLDTSTSGFAWSNTTEQQRFGAFAAIAGMNWIRDRFHRDRIETARGEYVEEITYESSSRIQVRQGLKILQMYGATPEWMTIPALDGPNAVARFPRDLRLVYEFNRDMAKRYAGRYLASESWNEANTARFGGHLIHEMCTLQKAAYLGFKAGHPEVTVCWNVLAEEGTPLQTEGLLENETWPYFETYNIHSYESPEEYEGLFTEARIAAWVTECGIPLSAASEQPWADLTSADEVCQARFVARSYASSLYAGTSRHFLFILPNFVDGSQFGFLRDDYTPRPAYIALAAAGRLLAGAKVLGRWNVESMPDATIYAFRARPDGEERDVLVAWSDTVGALAMPDKVTVQKVFDYLGRKVKGVDGLKIGPSATFVLLDPGAISGLPLTAPLKLAPFKTGEPSPIVLQIQHHYLRQTNDLEALVVRPGQQDNLTFFAYNFTKNLALGKVSFERFPRGWEFEPQTLDIEVAPMGRREFHVRVDIPESGRETALSGKVRLRGEFGEAGRTALAFRLMGDLGLVRPRKTRSIESHVDRWRDHIVEGGRMSRRAHELGGVLFRMEFPDVSSWCYPQLHLTPGERVDNSFDGLAVTIQINHGSGRFQVLLETDSGAQYWAPLPVREDVRGPQRVVALFRSFRWGDWTVPDPDGALHPSNVRTVMVGVNPEPDSKVEMVVNHATWVAY